MDPRIENPPMKIGMCWFNIGQNSLKNQRIRLRFKGVMFSKVFKALLFKGYVSCQGCAFIQYIQIYWSTRWYTKVFLLPCWEPRLDLLQKSYTILGCFLVPCKWSDKTPRPGQMFAVFWCTINTYFAWHFLWTNQDSMGLVIWNKLSSLQPTASWLDENLFWASAYVFRGVGC